MIEMPAPAEPPTKRMSFLTRIELIPAKLIVWLTGVPGGFERPNEPIPAP